MFAFCLQVVTMSFPLLLLLLLSIISTTTRVSAQHQHHHHHHNDNDHMILMPNSFACAGASDGQFVRRSTSCAAYYYCHDGGRAAAAECKEPLYFNARQKRCAPAHTVNCEQCSLQGIQNMADPVDARQYFECASGVRRHRRCSQGRWSTDDIFEYVI